MLRAGRSAVPRAGRRVFVEGRGRRTRARRAHGRRPDSKPNTAPRDGCRAAGSWWRVRAGRVREGAGRVPPGAGEAGSTTRSRPGVPACSPGRGRGGHRGPTRAKSPSGEPGGPGSIPVIRVRRRRRSRRPRAVRSQSSVTPTRLGGARAGSRMAGLAPRSVHRGSLASASLWSQTSGAVREYAPVRPPGRREAA